MSNQLPNNLIRLFWDYDQKSIDVYNHKRFIIERIMEKGNLDDIKWIYNNYSFEDIRSIITQSNNITFQTKNFWTSFLNIYEANSY